MQNHDVYTNEEAGYDAILTEKDATSPAPSYETIRLEAFENGYRKGSSERDFRDENARATALGLSVQYIDKGKTPETVVACAESFLTFLKGGDRDA